MSLRTRLIASIMLVLLVSLGVGGLSAGWTAARSVRNEMQAALGVGEQAVQHGLDDLPGSHEQSADLARLVQAFNGDRHLRATLVDAAGRTLVASVLPRPAQPAPGWFVRLVAPALPARRVPVETGVETGVEMGVERSVVVLEAEPLNEAGEVWTQLRDSMAVLALFCGLSIVLVSLVAGSALRPLKRISAALAAVGDGEYAVRLPNAGTPELAGLTFGFNAMVMRLGAAEAQNRRLHEQLVTLQEEERADLARDLHDEVGPFLFTVALDAAAIEQAAAAGLHGAIPERALAIREAVGHMQRHVRAMLKRLRLASPVEIGLAPALGNLVAFWKAHRPAVAFALEVAADEDSLDEATKAVIYRVAQEGLSNAVRHGHPGRIEIAVVFGDDGSVVARVSDDGIGMADVNEPGFGLAGMRERAVALGGSLHVAGGPGVTGCTVTARLPCRDPEDGARPTAAAA
ncbi:MAG TPA: ATP-binding protein [Acetobacteraceae bacterium]